MTKRYKIVFDGGVWVVLMPCPDGIDDVLEEFTTKAEAQAYVRDLRDEAAAVEGAERHYWAQYAYACGYRDDEGCCG